MTDHEDTWVAPQGSITGALVLTNPEGSWVGLTVNVIGDLRTRPEQWAAGSFGIPDDALGEVSRHAVAAWLRTAAAPEWAGIADFMVQARGGVILFEWTGGNQSFQAWLRLMGFGA